MIDVADMTAWHERRMEELQYPNALREELRRTLRKWLVWANKPRTRKGTDAT